MDILLRLVSIVIVDNKYKSYINRSYKYGYVKVFFFLFGKVKMLG